MQKETLQRIKKIAAGEFIYSFKQEEGGEKSMYWLTGIVGAIFMVAPYIFSYSENTTALWTSLIDGFVVVVASLWEGLESRKERWEYWIAGLVGIIAIVAPFALGFGNHASAMWTSVIMGGIIAVLAGGKLWLGGSSQA